MSDLTCVEIVDLVTDYLEGALAGEDLARFLEHVAGCEGCEAYIGQMRSTVRMLSETPASPLSSEAETALLGAFRRWSRDRAGK